MNQIATKPSAERSILCGIAFHTPGKSNLIAIFAINCSHERITSTNIKSKYTTTKLFSLFLKISGTKDGEIGWGREKRANEIDNALTLVFIAFCNQAGKEFGKIIDTY